MTTSGTYNFALNKSQIIARALQAINVYDINSTIGSDDYAYASDILNMMIKSWEGEGIKLWKRRQATLFPALDQYAYELGSVSGADNVTNTYVSTTVSTAVSSSSSTVIVDSATGLSTSMYIGLEQDDGTRIWGTISGISGTTLTCSFTTTDTAAAGNTVVAYTSKINRPIEMIRASLVDLKNNNQETTMEPLSFDEYFNLPVKNTPGRPNNWFYNKLLNNALPYTGSFYLFPQPSLVSTVVTFTYYDSIQDMLNTTDNADFPQEWTFALVTNLACELCAWGYGKFVELQPLQMKADRLKKIISDFDSDNEPLKFVKSIQFTNRRVL